MEILETYLSSLDKREQEDFHKFLAIKGKSKDRIDIRLLEAMMAQPELGNEDIIRIIYELEPETKISAGIKNKYYQWRSILTGHIEDFCVQRVTQDNKILYVVKLYLLARFLFNRKKFSAGFRYLRKAETMAKRSENYNLLEQIYALKLDFAWTQPSFNLNSLLKDIEETRKKSEIETRSSEAYNILLFKLNDAKRRGTLLELDTLLAEAKEHFGSPDQIQVNSKAFYKFTMAVYLVLDEKREFEKMLQHLRSAHEFMTNAQMFGDHNKRVELELVTLIMRSAVMALQYDMAETYRKRLQDLYRDFSENPILNFRSHVVEYVLLSCTGRQEEAAEKIAFLGSNPVVQELVKEDDTAFRMLESNQISSAFGSQDYTLAKRHLFTLINNEKRIRDSAGIESVFFLYIVELIIYCEQREYELVLKKIPALKKRFKPFAKTEEAQHYFGVIDLLVGLAKNEGAVSEELELALKNYLNTQHRLLVGTSQFLPLQPYFKSKISGRTYYEELMEHLLERRD